MKGGLWPPAREMLIKQSTWQGLNASTHNAVAANSNEDVQKWVIATRDLDLSQGLRPDSCSYSFP